MVKTGRALFWSRFRGAVGSWTMGQFNIEKRAGKYPKIGQLQIYLLNSPRHREIMRQRQRIVVFAGCLAGKWCMEEEEKRERMFGN